MIQRSIPLALAGAIVCLMPAAPAWSVQTVNTLPIGLDWFATAGGGGPINPAVLVGFNPQPDPPGSPLPEIDLSNPSDPRLSLTGIGNYTVIFGFKDPSGTPYSYTSPGLPTPNRDGVAQFSFLATAGDGEVFQVSAVLGGMTGAAVSFNPQPDPPDIANVVSFAFPGDPNLSFTVQDGSVDANGQFVPNGGLLDLSQIPEPTSLALLAAGVLALPAVRRRRGAA